MSDDSPILGLNPSNTVSPISVDALGKFIESNSSAIATNTANTGNNTFNLFNNFNQANPSIKLQSGRAYTATTGPTTTAGAVTAAMSVFNNTATNIYIFSVRFFGGNGAALHSLTYGTTNLALTSTITPVNLFAGGAASALAASNVTWQSTATAITGTTLDTFAQGNGVQFNQDGIGYLLPAGSSHSLSCYVVCGGAGPLGITFRWMEY